MRTWLRTRRARQALESFANAPLHVAAEEVGQQSRGLRHVQTILIDSLREERDPMAAVDRAAELLQHLQQDQDEMAEALQYARGLVLQHQSMASDTETLAGT